MARLTPDGNRTAPLREASTRLPPPTATAKAHQPQAKAEECHTENHQSDACQNPPSQDRWLIRLAAAAAPRFHHQWDPNRLRVEPEVRDEVIQALETRGHEVERSTRHWSAAEVIVVDPKTGHHLGGSDPRTDGGAIGVDSVRVVATEPILRNGPK